MDSKDVRHTAIIDQLIRLDRCLKKAEHDRDRYKRYIDTRIAELESMSRVNDLRTDLLSTALFVVLRNSILENAHETRMSAEEFDDLACAGMFEVYETIDFEKENANLLAAKMRNRARKKMPFADEEAMKDGQ